MFGEIQRSLILFILFLMVRHTQTTIELRINRAISKNRSAPIIMHVFLHSNVVKVVNMLMLSSKAM